jgi:hypothetical protein
MTRHAKQAGRPLAGRLQAGQPQAGGPQAGAVGRDPSTEATPEGHNPPVGQDDEPKGHPTSDRFHTEQAHRPGKKGA